MFVELLKDDDTYDDDPAPIFAYLREDDDDDWDNDDDWDDEGDFRDEYLRNRRKRQKRRRYSDAW